MPYIKAETRPPLDELVDPLVTRLLTRADPRIGNKDGDMNYVITRLLDRVYPSSYTSFNAAIGVLECVKQEFYRRKVAPYEDVKSEQNGDVFERSENRTRPVCQCGEDSGACSCHSETEKSPAQRGYEWMQRARHDVSPPATGCVYNKHDWKDFADGAGAECRRCGMLMRCQ